MCGLWPAGPNGLLVVLVQLACPPARGLQHADGYLFLVGVESPNIQPPPPIYQFVIISEVGCHIGACPNPPLPCRSDTRHELQTMRKCRQRAPTCAEHRPGTQVNFGQSWAAGRFARLKRGRDGPVQSPSDRLGHYTLCVAVCHLQ